jgi:hypothetical protein
MLLWEFCFCRIPYEDKSMMAILNHVINGGRETLDFVQIFNMLQDLYENHVLKKIDETSELDIYAPLTSFDEGIRADEAGNYEKAWKCFEEHANLVIC